MLLTTKRRLFLGLAFLLANSGLQAGELYGFTDGYGRLHLSTASLDSRYVRLTPPSSPRLRGTALRAEVGQGKGVQSYRSQVEEAARTYQVDAALLQAVIDVESGNNPTAVSPKGAAGLMQLMPETAQRYGVADRFDPVQNIRGGTRYLRDLLQHFGNDVALALAAFNAGEGAVANSGGHIPAYPETQAYVPKVLARYRSYREGPAVPLISLEPERQK